MNKDNMIGGAVARNKDIWEISVIMTDVLHWGIVGLRMRTSLAYWPTDKY